MANSISKSLVSSIKLLIQNAQNNAVRAINQERVLLYWNIGKHIVEEEQNGKERADYGAFLIKSLAKELTQDFGSSFSFRQLNFCRQFYLTFPIMNALRSQLNWTQYRLLLRIEKLKDENPTIGILLCADKNESMVKFALPENNTTILASKYQLYLPTEAQMLNQLKKRM